MMHGSLKHRINFSHRRMKSSIEAFDRAPTKKVLQKQQRPNHILERAKQAYKRQQFMETVEQLQEYLEFKSNDQEGLYLCGVSYLHLNEPYQAIHKLQKINSASAHKQQSCLLLAMAYAKVENSEKSLQVINECLDKYSRFEEGYCYRGKLYLKFQQYQLAESDFFYSLKLNTQSFISRVGLGDCYYQQHKYQLALKYYDESLQHIDAKFISNIGDINLKKGICYFELQMWNQTIHTLEKLRNQQLSSQSHYYLGVSYLKVNRKPEAILNLEYCIKLQAKDSKLLIQKGFKLLIQIYLTDFQFYDAVNTLKLVDSLKIEISCQYWKNLVEGCMLIIKSHYQDGLDKLNQVHDIIKKKKTLSPSNQNHQFQNEFLSHSFKPLKEKSTPKFVYNSKGRKSFSLKHVRKSSFNEQTRNKTLFKSIDDKPFAKPNFRSSDTKMKTFFKSAKKINKKVEKEMFSEDESIFVMPILLKFKAYGQFFINNYLRSLDTYQEYQSYMKNIFGKENHELMYNRIICQAFLLNKTELYKQSLQKMDLAVQEYEKYHNNTPVQPLLYKICTYLKLSISSFFQSQETTQSGYEYLQQVLDTNTIYNQQLQNHHLSHYYLAIMYYLCQKYQDAQSELQKTLKIVEECSWKFLYLKGIVEVQLGNFYEAIKQFTAGLILDQSPNLYLGRSVSFLLEGTKRKNDEQKAKYNLKKKTSKGKNANLSNQQQNLSKNEDVNCQVFVQNSFEDLQKFIELENDQDKISLWVSKLLFYNEAYEQANRALEKVEDKCSQLLELQFWLKFYDGEFQECGQIGNLMMDSFEGKLLSSEQQEQLILTRNNIEIMQILKYSKLEASYEKWILILHLFKRQKYSLLTKLLQKQIFESRSFQEEIQLKYNLGVAYLMQGQKDKAIYSFQNLLSDIKGHQKLQIKINKILHWKFDDDECLPDLSDEIGINGNHRVSQFLPYKSVQINQKGLKRIYLKPSVPFPQFPKPNIQIKVNKQFLETELDMDIVQKRIQAPWIKMNKQKVQFTEEIMEAYTDFLKDTKDMINPTNQQVRLEEIYNQSKLITEDDKAD